MKVEQSPSEDCEIEKQTLSAQLRKVEPGSIFGGAYQIVQLVGTGAVSRVYKARTLAADRIVALKLIKRCGQMNPARTAMFAHSARLNISHPNLVAVQACGLTEHGEPWLAAEFLEGTTLRELLASEGHLSLSSAMAIFRQLFGALSYLHAQSEVHMNLKPSSLFLLPASRTDGVHSSDSGCTPGTQPSFLKLADAGFGQLLLEVELEASDESARAPDSVLYMSPEQFRGDPIDAGSDVYATACLLFHCLTGRPPHEGTDLLDTMDRHLRAPVVFPSDPDVSLPVQAVLTRALDKDPETRYRTMSKFACDLEGALLGRYPQEAPPKRAVAAAGYRLPAGRRPACKKKKEPWVLLLTAVTVLLFVTMVQQCMSVVQDIPVQYRR